MKTSNQDKRKEIADNFDVNNVKELLHLLYWLLYWQYF